MLYFFSPTKINYHTGSSLNSEAIKNYVRGKDKNAAVIVCYGIDRFSLSAITEEVGVTYESIMLPYRSIGGASFYFVEKEDLALLMITSDSSAPIDLNFSFSTVGDILEKVE